ncbi:MAG: hypothetical protein HBSAPP04_26950 [Ignavibacteriaceae bacterium]|nr:MAG: hypothetical protein HBSAPP04_26950 [Ignavibacteriaceae bacterium]
MYMFVKDPFKLNKGHKTAATNSTPILPHPAPVTISGPDSQP